MSGKVKITRRQVKEDKFTTFMLTSKDRVQDELEKNWQYYVIGLVVTVVLIWAVAWYFDGQTTREAEASSAFSEALIQYQGGQAQVALLSLNQIVADAGGTTVAGDATYYLGKINLSQRNYDEAIRHFETYVKDYGGNRLYRAASYAGLAGIHEDRAEYTQAAEQYVKAANSDPEGPLQADYLVGAVRTYLKGGDVESARAQSKILEEEHANTAWTRTAARMIAEQGTS